MRNFIIGILEGSLYILIAVMTIGGLIVGNSAARVISGPY